jgi:hypothetical protein
VPRVTPHISEKNEKKTKSRTREKSWRSFVENVAGARKDSKMKKGGERSCFGGERGERGERGRKILTRRKKSNLADNA